MIAFWAAVPALVALALAGLGLDRALDLRLDAHGPWRWPLRALLALVVAVMVWTHVAIGAAVIGLLALERHLRGPTPLPDPTRTTRPLVLAVLLAIAIGTLRSAMPLYWDEHVWLAKARLACEGWDVLSRAALAPRSTVLPRGYPLGWPLAEALLAGLEPSTRALTGAAFALSALCLSLYAAMLARTARGALPLLVIASAPFAWIHWRSAYVDLPLGLLVASLALALHLARQRDAHATPIAMLAAALVGAAKDEGAAHVVAITLAFALTSRANRPELRRLALVVGAGLAPAIGWSLMRHAAGVANEDHAPSGLALDQSGALLVQALWHLADASSWGLVPAIAAAALVVTLARSADRTLALALLFSTLLLAVALLVGPERVRLFARSGTLLPRLAIQLLPLAAVIIAERLRPSRAPS